ncbi:MAG: LLM class flavin-dependent oxidoreductase [Dehalococcoidia bacterium]|nr:LLM class flavin-dependent oxidoreductase [Dehalococcoidia bacterium]MSQ16039.1 LLM class flavin-dependent oxidoreductase [Dehalococcoidia bacterium]
MHIGLVMECDYRTGATQEEAFSEAFEMVDMAEELGLDGLWLAERHFAAPRRPNDPMGAGIPSVSSVPLVMASAIAARTQRIRVGTGVSVLPLCHPVRLAEEAATVDQVSRGRLDFGIGRSGFPRSYEGYGIPYGESRERFQEALEIIMKAWTQDRFSHQSKNYTFNELSVVPKPYQKPHPPIRVAATTKETFPQVGSMGFPMVTGLRGFSLPDLDLQIKAYREAWHKAGHPGDGDVYLRLPAYVAETEEKARTEPEASTMRSYRRLAENFARTANSAGTTASEDRIGRAERLADVTYDELLQDRLAYGTPDMVVQRLRDLRDRMGLKGVMIEPNVGGGISVDRVMNSVRLFAREVAPNLK